MFLCEQSDTQYILFTTLLLQIYIKVANRYLFVLYTGMSAVIMNAHRYTLLTAVAYCLIALQPVSGKVCIIFSNIPLYFYLTYLTIQQKPYEILLDKFEPFSKTGLELFDPGTLRISRKGRNNFVFSGDFELFKNMGNDVIVIKTLFTLLVIRLKYILNILQVKFTNSKKGLDGKFNPLMAGESPICKQIQDDDKYYPIICESSNLPLPAPCPYPKVSYCRNFEHMQESLSFLLKFQGKYSINNFKVDEHFLPSIMPAGEYLTLVTFLKDGNELFGYKMYVTIKQD